MKQLLKLTLLLLALLLPATATAHDFEVGGIYYKINGNEVAVTYRGTSYYQYSNEYSGDVSIPATVTYNGVTYSVTSIEFTAFGCCSGLTSITIPNSVTSISGDAFMECNGLESINVLSGNPKYDSRSNCNAIIETASNTLISGCKNTIIPNSVTSIGNNAFFVCSGLTSITIPNSVISIGVESFWGCSGLTSISIPNSVTSIEIAAFGCCSGLTSVNIPNSVTSIGSDAFYNCSGLTSVNITDLEAWCRITFSPPTDHGLTSNPCYIAHHLFLNGEEITNLVIPNAITTIGNYSFAGCSGLTNISIPNSVTDIGDDAFCYCSGLTSITIPNSVTTIGDGAFYDCSGLTNITIPNSVTSIGEYAFSECSGLTNITIPNSVTTIGKSAFIDCTELTSITIPNSVVSIGKNAFSRCSKLNDVYSRIIDPSGVTMEPTVFYRYPNNYDIRTLYVPYGTSDAYQQDTRWSQYFGTIVEMDPVAVASIELDREAAMLVEGETLQLTATLLPEDATDKKVTWATSNPEVARVDSEGLVTAVSVGTATITAMTADGSNLSASCAVTVRSLSASECLTMDNLSVFHGDTIVILVKMVNEASIISFQTDIYLPEGLELLQEDGEYLIDPSSRMTSTHNLMSNAVSNGSIRVVCYSANYKPFKGESGDDLFYITVKVADDAEGDYTVRLKNTLFTTNEFEEIAVPDAAATVNVKAFIPGDANNSGNVTVTDVVVASQYILELNPEPFNFTAADVNTDGSITVTDVSRIAWIVLNPTLNAPLRAPALWNNGDLMSGNGITLAAGETRRVSIALDNAVDYNAFQFDLRLPAGLTASNFAVTDRAGSHAFDVNTLKNGDIRVLCYSPALTAISGHEGALLTFDVTATAAVNDDITVDGIELVTTGCQTVKLDAFAIGVNTATTVNETAIGKDIANIEYFNLAGQRITEPTTGVTLVVTTYTDGTRTTTKLIK